MAGNVPGVASVAPQKKAFDLSNQSDVLMLLNYVRQSSLDVELQSEARNTILDYVSDPSATRAAAVTNLLQGLPITVMSGLEIPTVNMVADTAQAATTPQGNRVITRTRSKPRFTSVAQKAAPVAAEPTTQAPPSFIPHSVDASESDVTPKTPVPDAVPTQVPPPQVNPSPEVTPPTAEPVVAAQSVVNISARINEIKHAVNEKVGNPVNLIDADNTIGREYMNALLAAMKASTGGEAGAQQAAMQRLEAAYAAVETMLQRGTDTPAPTPPPVSQPAGAEPSVAPDVPVEPEPSVEAADALAPVAEAAPAPSTPPPPPVPEATIATPPVSSKEPATPAGLRSLAADLHALEAASKPAAPTAPAATAAPATPVTPKASEATSTDPLFDAKVTAGLEQLLSEWSLFKSSGLFGTGPSGREHPLYKNLATTPMAAVISGRFEGVTPEIRQSITDYMNGWRYEQGMVHQIDETFEHYLRRVIKSILDKQPKAS